MLLCCAYLQSNREDRHSKNEPNTSWTIARTMIIHTVFQEKSIFRGIHKSLLSNVRFKLDPAVGEYDGEGHSSLGRQSEEKHGIRKKLGINFWYYDLASVTIVWVWGEGLELEATKIRWQRVVGKKPKAKWGALLSSPGMRKNWGLWV